MIASCADHATKLREIVERYRFHRCGLAPTDALEKVAKETGFRIAAPYPKRS